MTFDVRKFNNSEVVVDVREFLGDLQFMGYQENFRMVDGNAVDYPTHVDVFSDKLQDIIPVKLPEGLVMEDIPFMSPVEIVGKATTWIYDYEDTVYRGNNNLVPIKAIGFSLRAEGVKVANAFQKPQEQKPQEQKQEHKG